MTRESSYYWDHGKNPLEKNSDATAAVANSVVVYDGTEMDNVAGATFVAAVNTATVAALTDTEATAGAQTVAAGIQSLEFANATQITSTIADASNHQGLFVVKQTSSGTAGHTLTLTAGTFNGTNNVATLNAVNECLVVYFDSAGDGTIVENVGSVALS